MRSTAPCAPRSTKPPPTTPPPSKPSAPRPEQRRRRPPPRGPRGPGPPPRRSLTTRDVRQLVDEQCFPPRPAGRVGVEVEWLAVCLADPTQPVRPQVVGEAGAEL